MGVSDLSGCHALLVHAVAEEGQEVGCGLAAAGFGYTHTVTARHGNGQQLLLNGRRLRPLQLAYNTLYALAQARLPPLQYRLGRALVHLDGVVVLADAVHLLLRQLGNLSNFLVELAAKGRVVLLRVVNRVQVLALRLSLYQLLYVNLAVVATLVVV
jgi:hypothetical protein